MGSSALCQLRGGLLELSQLSSGMYGVENCWGRKRRIFIRPVYENGGKEGVRYSKNHKAEELGNTTSKMSQLFDEWTNGRMSGLPSIEPCHSNMCEPFAAPSPYGGNRKEEISGRTETACHFTLCCTTSHLQYYIASCYDRLIRRLRKPHRLNRGIFGK